MDAWISDLRQKFEQVFGAGGGRVQLIRSPGRVNLIGEHTDYNDGFVCPMAIEPEVRIACRPNTTGTVRIASTVFPNQVVEFSVQKKIERADPKWANYMRGTAAELIQAGVPVSGMDALYDNTLPVGGGLSSSAAIEVGTGLALLTLGGQTIDRMRLALLCQKAEHEYALVPCGIMDQMIVATAKAGHATLFDCRSMEKQFVPIDENELRVVIVNSMVKHELSGGEYAERRQQCEQATAFFAKDNPQVKALRDVGMKQVEAARGKLDDVVFRRARHVVGENQRTVEAATALGQKNYERAGELMVQSHDSLRDDYEVSCEELDFLAAEAMKVKGVYGARMTGGGFGGCIVALTQPRAVDSLRDHLTKTYEAKYKITPQVIVTKAMSAAGQV